MKIQLRSYAIYGVALAVLALAACTKPAEDALKRITRAGLSFTPDDFIKAAGSGELEIVGLFLQAGMDRNVQDARGYTALIQASENGKKEVVRALFAGRRETPISRPRKATPRSSPRREMIRPTAFACSWKPTPM